MNTVQTLQLGLQRHQAGDLAGAEQLYRQILAAEPEHVNALHLLGLVALATGRLAMAAELIARALRANPAFAEAHSNLAIVLQQQGKLADAVAHWREAARLKPDFAAAHNYLAIGLMQQGDPAAALASWRDAVRANPAEVDALNNLGVALYQQGSPNEAVECLHRAVQLRPDHLDAQRNLGNMLRELRRPAEAAECYRRVLQSAPDDVVTLRHLGTMLRDEERFAEATACFRHVAQLRAGDPDAWNDLGTALKQQGNLVEAGECFLRTLQLRPDYVGAIYNLANNLKDQGRLSEAVDRYRQALRLDPHYAEAHGNLAVALLLQGDFTAGWPEYEWRRRTQPAAGPNFPEPPWDGSPVAGRTILLHAEQGLGDTLQFVRYAGVLKRQGARVLVGCPRTLVPLLTSSPDIDAVVSDGDEPLYDEHAPLLSLPAILRTTLGDLPAEVPYLFADPERASRWRPELGPPGTFKIGLAWQGNPTYRDDRWRSIPLAQFAALARVPGVRFFSLQKGWGSEQIAAVADRLPIVDLGSRLDVSGGAFLDTAAVMQSLDLVITSDTAIAHLAGALAVPVWLALAFVPDWRWLMDREDCPWYPTMQLFRQPEPGNWPAVFERMAAELERRVAAAHELRDTPGERT